MILAMILAPVVLVRNVRDSAALRRAVSGLRACTLGLACVAALAGMGGATAAAPFVPQDDTTVLDILPSPGDPSIRALRALAAEQRAIPNDIALALTLARRYVEQARRDGDPRYAGYAEAVLRPWLTSSAPPSPVRLMDAVFRQYRHDFSGALIILDTLLSAQPDNAEARLFRAAVRQVTGRLDEAGQDCNLLRGRIDPLAAATCRTLVAEQSGNAAAAGALLELALKLTGPPPIRLWALTAAAEMAARRSDLTVAEAHYKEALTIDRRDTAVLASYADFLLENERPAEARVLLGSDTRSDAVLLRQALAAHATGDADAADLARTQSERFDEGRRRGDTVHQREEARFRLHVLGDVPGALALARVNWDNQKELSDARILLEAAVAAHAPEEAVPVREWLSRHHNEDRGLARLCEAAVGAS